MADDDDDLPGAFEIKNPPETFRQLNPELRAFFGELNRENVKDLRAALRLYSSAQVLGKALRWVGIVFAVAFGGTAAMDHVSAWMKALFGGKP